jgi:hypothetical protein
MTLSASKRNELSFKLKDRELAGLTETNRSFHQVQNLRHVLFFFFLK